MNDVKSIIDAAFAAAAEKTAAHLKEHPNEWYPCGFAWVTIKPARGKLINFLRENGIGYKSDYGGWVVYNPSDNSTQWMDAKEVGAKAFAEKMAEHFQKHKFKVETRID